MKLTDTGRAGDGRQNQQSSGRLPYEKPEIVDRGRLVEIALGGSPGTGDSGGGVLTEDPLI